MDELNILVLGSEGAIGTRLVEMMSENIASANIIRVGRQEVTGKESSNCKLHKADLLDPNEVRSIFNQYDIQIVIFCAAKWNGLNQDPLILEENVTMFNNVLSSLTQSVNNFIYLSSSAVYSQPNEDDALPIEVLPHSTYGRSKLINEILLLNKAEINNMAATIYRPFHVVSPYEIYCPGRSHITTDFVHRYIELDIDFNWKELSKDIFIPFFWVDDLCGIIISNLRNKKSFNRAFNVGSSKSFSILSLAFCIATIAGKYGLSSKEIPSIEQDLGPIENNMNSGLNEIVGNLEKRSLMDIVENFIVKKYGLNYEY